LSDEVKDTSTEERTHTGQAVAAYSPHVMVELVPTTEATEKQMKAIRAFQYIIQRELKQGPDYDVIPGTGTKPTLLKPGAEKIITLFGCRPQFLIVDKIERWDPHDPLFYYRVNVRLIDIRTGTIMGEGEGSCNSYEDKYRYRWCYSNELPEGIDKDALTVKWFTSKGGKKYPKYRFLNTEVFSQVNTFLKMAQKRALVSAALVLGRLSDLFTQDMEDLRGAVEQDEAGESAPKAQAPEKPKETTQKTQEQTPSTTGTEAEPEPANSFNVTEGVSRLKEFIDNYYDHKGKKSTLQERLQIVQYAVKSKTGKTPKSEGEAVAVEEYREALDQHFRETFEASPF